MPAARAPCSRAVRRIAGVQGQQLQLQVRLAAGAARQPEPQRQPHPHTLPSARFLLSTMLPAAAAPRLPAATGASAACMMGITAQQWLGSRRGTRVSPVEGLQAPVDGVRGRPVLRARAQGIDDGRLQGWAAPGCGGAGPPAAVRALQAQPFLPSGPGLGAHDLCSSSAASAPIYHDEHLLCCLGCGGTKRDTVC